MELTNKNYFSQEAMRSYWSVSQFKAFMKCEAAAMAELNGEYRPEVTDSLLIGSYVDAYFEGTLDAFKETHPELFKKDGTLKAQFVKADEIIHRLEADELFMQYMSGDKQVIATGELFGYPWKIKVDSLFNDKIVDLKIMRDFEPVYVEGQGKVSFIDAWGYDIQGAVYQAIMEQHKGEKFPFYIAAATKEKETDLEIFHLPQPVLDTALSIVKNKIDHFADVKLSIEPPKRCGKCAYCKRTKKLAEPVEYEEV